jgi:hypothetical protein
MVSSLWLSGTRSSRARDRLKLFRQGGSIFWRTAVLVWFAHMNLIDSHMLFGWLAMLGLLVTTREPRILDSVGIICALTVPIFGLSQFPLLVENLHWLIQTLHMLVGIGAMVLTGILGTRYVMLRYGETRATAGSSMLLLGVCIG